MGDGSVELAGEVFCWQPAAVKSNILPAVSLAISLLFAGCLTAPVSDSGGISGTTVPNTNVTAIVSAAQDVFAQSGYSPGPMNYPTSISFDKSAGAFGQAMWGSFGQKASVRAKLRMTPVPGTNDYRLSVVVMNVSNAGQAGFEDSRKLIGPWAAEFRPLLQKIRAQAAGAGPGL